MEGLTWEDCEVLGDLLYDTRVVSHLTNIGGGIGITLIPVSEGMQFVVYDFNPTPPQVYKQIVHTPAQIRDWLRISLNVAPIGV